MDQVSAKHSTEATGLLGRIWQNKAMFATVFFAIIGLTVVALIVLPVRYVATGSVIVAEPEPGNANESVAWAQKIGDPADLESQLLVIRSPRLLRLVMSTPGVQDLVSEECRRHAGGELGSIFSEGSKTCDKLKDDSAVFIDYVQNRYSVVAVGRSRVINISYQSPLPKVAQKMANALTSAFLEDQRTAGSNNRETAASWLWQELGQLDAQVREADAKIQAFRRTNGLTRGATAPISSEQLTSISQQLAAAEGAREYAAARLRQIKAGQSSGSGDAPDVLSSRSIADLKQQLTVTSAQLASASDLLGPKHPTLLALQRERALIQERLTEEIASIATSAQKTYDANEALVTSLKKQMEAVKTEVGSATSAEASIENLVRDTEIKRRQYAELYQKASALETERRVLIGNTRLVSLAELPIKPFFPKKIPFLAAGTTIAVLLAVAASLAGGPMSGWSFSALSGVLSSAGRVRTGKFLPALPVIGPKLASFVPLTGGAAAKRAHPPSGARLVEAPGSELSLGTGKPILARLALLQNDSISLISAILNGGSNLPLSRALQLAQKNPGIQESLRGLAATLLGADGGTRGRKILITSPGAAEGKTFLALLLAQYLAATGRRVLVVECDLVNPMFETTLALNRGGGLHSVLHGQTLSYDAVVATAIPNLDAVAADTRPANPADMAARNQMLDLSFWSRVYDVVVVDGPPAAALPNCRNLAVQADEALLCLRYGSPVSQAIAASRMIEAAGGKVSGLAITMDNSSNLASQKSSPNVTARTT
jgi:succinoglycan biosynthesis transport protein ExoP